MIDYLFWGQIFFIALALLGWFILGWLVNYWKEKDESVWVVPAIHLFPYFLGIFLVSLAIAVYLGYRISY
ncbi:MAG: hypothetical protein A3D35_02760 [Candidatus Staskawiczbacteria bacterium RIFCSPHIGHO2_02_FULL_34_9]|uniref:Uncharacterized protein n=1 Tax=Candidatus Staskawiczbacteria bacterium RIFCSPHIGHO2_02_FULL_34_9 TaxID=1802206 RepID=A0A1G2I3L7_9BACT|nr:MAG: hypothetical protein A3D35_02760 [Candidatus Staskawiczbacteria bacterium RIFCSPHIGHO2_02_FULL_34_9]